jgi:hypothetical protein
MKSSIFNFSQQKFRLVHKDNVTVGQLETLANQHADKPFIFYDGIQREAACVVPARVKWAIEKFNLAPGEIAARTGIFDILRRNQGVVHRDQPSSRIAQFALSEDLDAVLVVGDKGEPAGLFLPGLVAERLPKTPFVKDLLPPALRQQIQALKNLDDLPQAMAKIETQDVAFHSELVNEFGGEPYICEGDGGHIRNSCPCPSHPFARCSRRQIA